VWVSLSLVEAGAKAVPGSLDGHFDLVDATETIEYAHPLGAIVTACVGALSEHLDAAIDGRGGVLTRVDDGRYRLRLDGEPPRVPFTLLASRPA
jgi:hypothetical protein